MKKKVSLLAAGLALGLSALTTAAAQEGVAAQEPVATLQVTSGSVQASGLDGEFIPAQSGVQLAPGNRVLVPSGGSATVIYPNGCQVNLTTPGVHTVTPTCTPALARTTTGGSTVSGGAAVGIIAGGVALTALTMEETLGDEDDERPPVSR
ncbi:hypothetical protein B1992_04145 [Pseudoxanthomonas broegbernensis]|uniref:Uncharacterized protein n=1 Tax=Pseudoxanthomonas broegbernensis TaxID=83619 RepID=A0A7V8GNL3_9GAMM|nr:hypothetical protein [Pseudoxanthomonas broegbernensis]KAF1687187.1 hypothetical protein B1992_04145 [Pseudoxanthomonas broegbernensis]MBB6065832.1 hypothetical protein [Pseudoxanthomonas broegbernensis]